MSFVGCLVLELEIYSIHKLSLILPALRDVASSIQKQVLKSLGLPICIGGSKTKTLAKTVNHMAKKKPFYNEVCILESDEDTEEALKWSEIEDLRANVASYAARLGAKLRKHKFKAVHILVYIRTNSHNKKYGSFY